MPGYGALHPDFVLDLDRDANALSTRHGTISPFAEAGHPGRLDLAGWSALPADADPPEATLERGLLP